MRFLSTIEEIEDEVVATTDTSIEDDVAQYSNVATKGIGDAGSEKIINSFRKTTRKRSEIVSVSLRFASKRKK